MRKGETMNEQFVMRPGDTFVAEECGCAFTVESGPADESMARQAPRCCCGHEMIKQGASPMSALSDQGSLTNESVSGPTAGNAP